MAAPSTTMDNKQPTEPSPAQSISSSPEYGQNSKQSHINNHTHTHTHTYNHIQTHTHTHIHTYTTSITVVYRGKPIKSV